MLQKKKRDQIKFPLLLYFFTTVVILFCNYEDVVFVKRKKGKKVWRETIEEKERKERREGMKMRASISMLSIYYQ